MSARHYAAGIAAMPTAELAAFTAAVADLLIADIREDIGTFAYFHYKGTLLAALGAELLRRGSAA